MLSALRWNRCPRWHRIPHLHRLQRFCGRVHVTLDTVPDQGQSRAIDIVDLDLCDHLINEGNNARKRDELTPNLGDERGQAAAV